MPLVMLEARMRDRHLSVVNLPWVHETAHEIAHESLYTWNSTWESSRVCHRITLAPSTFSALAPDWLEDTNIPEEVQTCDRRCQADSSKTSCMTALSEHALQVNNFKTVIHHQSHHSKVQSRHEPFKTNIMPACRHTLRACAKTFKDQCRANSNQQHWTWWKGNTWLETKCTNATKQLQT